MTKIEGQTIANNNKSQNQNISDLVTEKLQKRFHSSN